jgi:membrane-associated phospholipid phosphatase
MDRRIPAWVALVSASFAALGLLLVDRPLAEWIHGSGIAHSRVFAGGLAALDFLTAMHLWFWLAGCSAIAIGVVGLAWKRHAEWPRAWLAAGIVQIAALHTMILGKSHFGRMRPSEVFEKGDWSQVWFVGGGSFPSGHSAFYFGLLLPLAASCPLRWLRNLLLAIPVFVAVARLGLERHFLSDVAASAVIAALYTLLAAWLLARWNGARARHEAPSGPA